MRVAVLALVAAFAVAAAGCGGARLTQAEFNAKTSKICAKYTKRADKEIAPVTGNPLADDATPEELARFGRLLDNVARLFGQQLRDLSRVRPPGESQDRYARVLRLYADLDNALYSGARAARRGDRLGVQQAENELTNLGGLADELNFKCA